MKISIYIPTLKRDELFDRCLRSIEQSIAAAGEEALEHELVVVEGVSPLSEARNEGLRRTTGEWIATADADDVVEDAWFGEICRAIRRAEEPGLEIDDIVFDMTVVTPTRQFVRAYGREEVVDGQTLKDDLLRDMRLGNYAWLHVTRRRLWANDRFERTQVMEDYVTMHRIVGKARKVLYIARPLYRYVVRDGSLCQSGREAEIARIIFNRAERWGGCAKIGASLCAYNMLYERLDKDGFAHRWIWRHLFQILSDGEVDVKWKLKFLLAAFGIVIRRPK